MLSLSFLPGRIIMGIGYAFFRVTTMCLLAAQFALQLWKVSERCGQRGERTYEGETRHHVAIRMEGGARTVPAN